MTLAEMGDVCFTRLFIGVDLLHEIITQNKGYTSTKPQCLNPANDKITTVKCYIGIPSYIGRMSSLISNQKDKCKIPIVTKVKLNSVMDGKGSP